MRRLFPLFFLALPLLAQDPPPFPDGFKPDRFLETAHFRIYHEGAYAPVGVTGLLEGLHAKLMLDLRELAPWAGTEKISVFVYAGADSYVALTGIPAWSAAFAVPDRRQIHCYPSPELQRILAHEMSHLLFTPFFDKGSPPPAWLNEGLAKVMEFSYGQEGDTAFMNRHAFSRRSLPLGRLFAFDYHHEPSPPEAINLWYQQAASVAAYMTRRLPRASFTAFCAALRDGKPTDEALRSAYGFQVPDAAALERLWRESLSEK
jgi:hypothetical protein